MFSFYFFFNDTATTEIYTLSLHDALPISSGRAKERNGQVDEGTVHRLRRLVFQHRRNRLRWLDAGEEVKRWLAHRSEEHTSELQSRQYLVCRLLLEKKKRPAWSG